MAEPTWVKKGVLGGQWRDEVAKKLEKVESETDSSQVYVKNADGTQGMVDIASSIADGSSAIPTADAVSKAIDAAEQASGNAYVKKSGDTISGDVLMEGSFYFGNPIGFPDQMTGTGSFVNMGYSSYQGDHFIISLVQNDGIYNQMDLSHQATKFGNPVGIDSGGTGAKTAAEARANLGIDSAISASIANATIKADQITEGTISIDRLPQGALERIVDVENEAARFSLTSDQVQLGDTVRQADTGVMYVVVDESKLGEDAGYREYTAGSAARVPVAGVEGLDAKLGEYVKRTEAADTFQEKLPTQYTTGNLAGLWGHGSDGNPQLRTVSNEATGGEKDILVRSAVQAMIDAAVAEALKGYISKAEVEANYVKKVTGANDNGQVYGVTPTGDQTMFDVE